MFNTPNVPLMSLVKLYWVCQSHEFRFWLAIAYVGLGDPEQARKELSVAIETSPTRKDRAVYAAKLERLTDHRPN